MRKYSKQLLVTDSVSLTVTRSFSNPRACVEVGNDLREQYDNFQNRHTQRQLYETGSSGNSADYASLDKKQLTGVACQLLTDTPDLPTTYHFVDLLEDISEQRATHPVLDNRVVVGKIGRPIVMRQVPIDVDVVEQSFLPR